VRMFKGCKCTSQDKTNFLTYLDLLIPWVWDNQR